MIHLLKNIEGWAQNGPMGNDLMQYSTMSTGPGGGAGAGRRAAGIAASNRRQPSFSSNFLLPDNVFSQFKPFFKMQPEGENILSPEEFEEKYFSGSINPFGKETDDGQRRTRYYFDYDFDSPLIEGKTRHGGSGGSALGADRYKEGYMFYDKADAYRAYKDTMQKQYETGTGQFEGAGAYANISPGDLLNRRTLLDAFTEAKGGETRPEDVVPEIKAADLRGLHSGYYTPQVEKAKTPLIDRLLANIESTQGLGSGFAGYGAREEAESSLLSGFQDDVQRVYDEIVGAGQMQSLENLVSLIDMYDVATDDLES